MRDNLFRVFGTKSYFAMLSPSLRVNAFTGLEWSFQMIDLGFTESGDLIETDSEQAITEEDEGDEVEMIELK